MDASEFQENHKEKFLGIISLADPTLLNVFMHNIIILDILKFLRQRPYKRFVHTSPQLPAPRKDFIKIVWKFL